MLPGESGVISVTRHPKGWRARVRYRDWDGVLCEMARYATTRTAAKDRVEVALAEALSGGNGVVTGRTTVAELAELWLLELQYLKLSDASRRAYSGLTKKWVLGQAARGTNPTPLKELSLAQVTPARINVALRRIAEHGGNGSAKTMHTVYSNMFELALKHEAVDTNPARSARFSPEDTEPKTKDHKRAFTPEELADVLAKVDKDERAAALQIVTLVKVLAGTGIRIGEAINLDWGHLDSTAGRLRVPGTKTDSSRRTICPPPWLIDALEARRAAVEHATDDSPMLPSPLGHRRDGSNTIRAVGQFLVRAGYPWATSHTFRKTVATRLDEAGLSPREIANHMGHSSPTMTMDVYMDRRAATERAASIL